MRKLTSVLLVLLIGVISVGCDSSDDASDADLFVGTWALTNVTDATGSQLAAFGAAFSSVVLVNQNTGSFALNVTPTQGDPLSFTGTYVVNEGTNGFTLNANVGGTTAPLAFTYTFNGDDSVGLQAGATTSLLLNQLFGTTLEAPATITITRQ